MSFNSNQIKLNLNAPFSPKIFCYSENITSQITPPTSDTIISTESLISITTEAGSALVTE